MNTHYYRKISIIKYNSKRFQVFKDEKNRYAFLELDENDRFIYPSLEDFIGLANIFSKDLDKEVYFRNSKNNEDTKYSFKVFVVTASTMFALSSALFYGLQNQNIFTNDKVEQVISIQDNYEPEELKQEIKDSNIPVEVTVEKSVGENRVVVRPTEPINNYVKPTTVTSDMYGVYENQIDIYNSLALNQFLGEKTITLNDINQAVDDNVNLNDDLKGIIKEFASTMMKTYPDVDMRLFYENVKRLNMVYETDESIKEHGSMMAWFNYEFGEIHVNQNINLNTGSYDLMVLRHEIGHMMSLGILNQDGKKIVCLTKNGGYGEYLQEAIDVIVTSNPYEDEYNFTDFGYGINANELESVINVIPGFDYSVLVNQDVYNIADYLNTVNPNSISASRFIDLMDMQTIAYYNAQFIQSDSNEFKDIYTYIANTYINYVITPDMTYDEIMSEKEELVKKLNENLNYTYGIVDYAELDNVFNNYMIENNIVNTSLIKH